MKLKKLLNENLWNERKFGQSLPTLEDTTKAYKLKKEQEVNEEPNSVCRWDHVFIISYMLFV